MEHLFLSGETWKGLCISKLLNAFVKQSPAQVAKQNKDLLHNHKRAKEPTTWKAHTEDPCDIKTIHPRLLSPLPFNSYSAFKQRAILGLHRTAVPHKLFTMAIKNGIIISDEALMRAWDFSTQDINLADYLPRPTLQNSNRTLTADSKGIIKFDTNSKTLKSLPEIQQALINLTTIRQWICPASLAEQTLLQTLASKNWLWPNVKQLPLDDAVKKIVAVIQHVLVKNAGHYQLQDDHLLPDDIKTIISLFVPQEQPRSYGQPSKPSTSRYIKPTPQPENPAPKGLRFKWKVEDSDAFYATICTDYNSVNGCKKPTSNGKGRIPGCNEGKLKHCCNYRYYKVNGQDGDKSVCSSTKHNFKNHS